MVIERGEFSANTVRLTVRWAGDIVADSEKGRLNFLFAKATEWASPGGLRSQPYGMAVINDVVWYNEAGTKPNTMVRFDPKTGKFQTWIIPSGGNVVRNVSVTKDGNIAIASSGVNRIGLVKID